MTSDCAGGRSRAARAAVSCVAALCCLGIGLSATLAASAGDTRVVLGSRAFAAPHGEGWGTARPAKIFNGGDPSGLVTHIHWMSWGGATATGYGSTFIFKPRGGYYDRAARIELRARGLGRCSPSGPPAYTVLSFRVPSHPGGPLGAWMLWSGARSICSQA